MKWQPKWKRFSEPIWDRMFLWAPMHLSDTHDVAWLITVHRYRRWRPWPSFRAGGFVEGFYFEDRERGEQWIKERNIALGLFSADRIGCSN